MDCPRALISLPAGLQKIQNQLQASLTPRRFAHSQATAHLAAQLAALYGVAGERAYLAGLLHDCARDLDQAALKRLLKNYPGRNTDSLTRKLPQLWHNPVGAYLARHKYGVKDPGIIRAVARHSTGGPGMNTLDQIIYVADYTEPLRKHPAAVRIRRIAYRNLDQAVKAVTQAKIAYLRKRGRPLHPHSLALAKEYSLKSLDQN